MSVREAPVAERMTERLQDLPGQDQADRVLSAAADALLSGRERLADALNGRWLGHALHPALSDLPIGFWTSSVVADLLGMRRAAQALGIAGSASAVATVASGLADWRHTAGDDRRMGTAHATLNGAGLLLQIGALAARAARRNTLGRGLAVVGVTATAAAAWLGGELILGRGTMVDRLAWTSGPDEWTPAMPDEAVAEGGTRCAELDGRQILVSRRHHRLHAIEATCSHAGGALAEGDVAGGVVTCPSHGSRFDLADGRVRRGPATFPQRRLETRVRDGMIEVRGGS